VRHCQASKNQGIVPALGGTKGGIVASDEPAALAAAYAAGQRHARRQAVMLCVASIALFTLILLLLTFVGLPIEGY
jgi:hypothetical protein